MGVMPKWADVVLVPLISLIIAALLSALLILAIGIPFINPRSGRSGSLVVTVISFFTYYNMVNMSRNWIGAGDISFTHMLLALHLPVFILGCLILFWRQQQGVIFYKARPVMGTSAVSSL